MSYVSTVYVNNMEELPKIVVQRLRGTPPPAAHPDADLLAAFAEESLGERERALLLEHLAQCGDCREIVSLSQPHVEAIRVAAVAAVASRPTSPQARAGWLRGPVFRWVAVAACVAVVAVGARELRRRSLGGNRNMAAAKPPSAVFYEQKSQTERDQPASTSQSLPDTNPATRSPASVDARKDAAPAEKTLAMDRMARNLAKNKSGDEAAQALAGAGAMQRPSPAPAQMNGGAGGVIAKLPEPSGSDKKQEQALRLERERMSTAMEANSVRPASPATTSQQVEVEANEAKDHQAKADQGNAANRAVPAPAPPPPLASNGTLARGKVSTGSFAAGDVAMLRAADSFQGLARWTLSPDGSALLRSLDGGKTWQSVPVAGNVTFRAVSAMGLEVWAGGSRAALFHSSDAGMNWKKIEPLADGKPLQGDIIAIEFTDLRHGKLTTANHEVWATSDAGETWHKQ